MASQLPLPEGLLAKLDPSGKPRPRHSSPRSHVWQIEPAGAPAVVKQIVDGPGAADLYAREVAGLQLAVTAFLALAEGLTVPTPPRVRAELDALVDRLAQAPGHALLHGDPCPGNDLHTADGIRFIDFEQASLGNGLVELAYLRFGFPTCWCVTTTPEPLLAEAEAAYRATWLAATGSEVVGDLAAACAGWLIRGDALVQRAHRGSTDHLARILKRDWSWGTVTARQRLTHRLGVVADLTVDHPELNALHQLATDLRHRMPTRWPTLQPPVPSPVRGPAAARRPADARAAVPRCPSGPRCRGRPSPR